MAKLQFLANMNISPLTVEQLRTRGWDITRVSEIMEKGSKDQDILIYAQKEGLLFYEGLPQAKRSSSETLLKR